jgi:hypothetical protein
MSGPRAIRSGFSLRGEIGSTAKFIHAVYKRRKGGDELGRGREAGWEHDF